MADSAGIKSLMDSIPQDNWYLDANLSAYHLDRDRKNQMNYNESNPGFGIEHDDGDWRQMFGQYKNSLRGNSNYALLGYTPIHYDTPYGNFKLGGVVGGITGYPYLPLTPAAGLLGTYDYGNFGANLIVTPTVRSGDKQFDGFIGLQGRYKFK